VPTGVDESQVSVPLSVRLRFGHAAVQVVADEIGVDVLHIKGATVDPSLRPVERSGTDVDVMVRPQHVVRLDGALRQRGWMLYSTFEYGSPFGHAQTYQHESWGFLDIHRFFPGIRAEPAVAFDRLWRDRGSSQIAGITCPVPSIPAQGLLLALNSARAAKRRGDRAVDADSNAERRAQIEALVVDLDASVAFAAANGTLERFRSERDYRLWRVVSQGGSRSEEWWARVRAAPNLAAALRVAARAPLVNVDSLAHRLGRRPTRREIVIEFFNRPVRALGEARRGFRNPRVSR